MGNFMRDVRYGARMLARSPGFTIVAVLTLALGIGATTAIFSVVHAVLLRPLPFADPDRIVWFSEKQGGQPGFPFSPFELLAFRDQARTFEHIAAVRFQSYNLAGSDRPEHVRVAIVTPSFFPVLGAEPLLGRVHVAGRDDAAGAPRVGVLGNGFWKQHFNADPDVLGKTIRLNDESVTVVGILRPDFSFGGEIAVWLNPADVVPETFPNSKRDPVSDRGMHYLLVLGRLKPEATLAQAQADLDGVTERIRKETGSDHALRLMTFEDYIASDIRPTLRLLLGAVGFMLLIAAANVANLLLARGSVRAREVAVRSALGAGRSRLARQFLTEGLLLALAGGAVGLLLALWGVDALRAMSPAEIPRARGIRVDGWVLLFTVAVSLLTTLLFGLAPALEATRSGVAEALREGGARVSARNRLRAVLVTAEMALSVVLLVGGGLLLRSFAHVVAVEPGFRPEHLVTLRLSFAGQRYAEPGRTAQFIDEMIARFKALPGVEGVAVANDLPFERQDTTGYPIPEGRASTEATNSDLTGEHAVNPEYFRAMGIPIVRGRAFTDADVLGAPLVAIVSQTAAKRLWPGEDPLERRVRLNREEDAPWITVVGIVGDVRYDGLGEAFTQDLYVPFAQVPWSYATVALRTRVGADALAAPLRAEVQALDPDQPIFDLRSMDDVLNRSLASRRFVLSLVGLFALLSLALAAMGLYGVMAYLVTQRSHEIGVRMSLGARPGDIARLVVGQGFRFTLPGLALGLAGSLGFTRFLSGMLFGVGPTDAPTLATVTLVLVAVALAASYVPARRATRIDPLARLRSE